MTVRILEGDVLAVLRTLEAESVQCVVTSPPYYGLRDYGLPPTIWGDGWTGCLGLEPTPTEFIAHLVEVFREVKRVLRRDGTAWVNLGDSYAGSFKGNVPGPNSIVSHRWRGSGDQMQRTPSSGIPAKNLLLIPERFAIAVQEAGWCVRSRIAWCKKSAMPESVKDRPTSAWEHIWLFSKSRTYYWDQNAVREPLAPASVTRLAQPYAQAASGYRAVNGAPDGDRSHLLSQGANMRNFWLLSPEPSREDHYAAFPTAIPKRAILAGTSEKGQCPACGAPWMRVIERTAGRWTPAAGQQRVRATGGVISGGTARCTQGATGEVSRETTGWQPSCTCDAGEPVPCVVLDCFGGSGTTGLVADRMGRDAILIELSPTYAEMARRRIASDLPLFADVVVEKSAELAERATPAPDLFSALEAV